MKFLDFLIFLYALYRLHVLVDHLDDLKCAPVFLKDEAAPRVAFNIFMILAPLAIIILRIHEVI